jgi:CHAD domain-containing protein
MKKKTQIAYFDQQWEDMLTYFKSFLLEGKQDDLHSFRVQIKKLRALFIVFDEATGGKHQLQKEFKPVRSIFKHAGEIRNAHVNLKLGAHYKVKNEQFENSQRKVIANGVTEFKLKGLKYLKKIDRSHTSIKHQLHFIQNKSITRFYQQKLQEIASALTQNQFDEDLHTSRKQIKVLVYNYQLAGKAVEKRMTFNPDYMDDLQGAIGDWHDNVLAIELFSSDELNDQPVAARIRKKNSKLEKRIAELSADFLTKATAAPPAVAGEDTSK